MDSDILVTGDFPGPFACGLSHQAGFFSGSSSWCKAQEQILPASFQNMFGRYHHTEQGTCLGSTYFAIYDNRILNQLIQTTGIDFRHYRWKDIPTQYQAQLAKLRLNKAFYDTGKLINLLLLVQGQSLAYEDLTLIQHIGGLSRINDGRSALSILRKSATSLRWQWRRLNGSLGKGAIHSIQPEIQAGYKVFKRRTMVAAYFGQLLQALFERQPLPDPPAINDAEIEEKVTLATTAIVNLYQEVGGIHL
jgi:hypothetical protein